MKRAIQLLVAFLIFGLCLLSVATLFYNTDWRYLKMIDFPRIQFFIAGLFFLLVLLLTKSFWKKWFPFLLITTMISIGIQGYKLYPYTPLSTKAVADSPPSSQTDTFSLLLYNVYMHNKKTSHVVNLVNEHRPDVVLLYEVNSRWQQEMGPVREKYSYVKEVPNDETYGMFLYSQLPVEELTVHYLSNDDVPSFAAELLVGETPIQLYSVHPPPPTYFKNLPDNQGEEENELVKIGNMVEQQSLPTIVAGDFNDVAWSKTSRLMQTNGKLNDVRIGRGFYNTFDAKNPFLRWPLDHLFVSDEFSVQSLERLPAGGSDHFPLLATFHLE